MDIPSIIKHYRSDKSLREFAAELSVSHAAIQQWESGETEPTNERISAFVNDPRDWVRELGQALFMARNGKTLKTLIERN